MAVAVSVSACSGPGGTSTTDDSTPEIPEACGLIELGEVEALVGEPVHEPEASDVAPGVSETTCLWADVDPDEPGRLLSVTLTPRGEVGEPEPGPDDQVYELSTLGDDSFGAQTADGAVRVVFGTSQQWVDLVYEVLPPQFMEGNAIDRLIRLAEVVRTRVLPDA